MIMLLNRLVFLLLILATISGCEKSLKPDSEENLIFGVAYGFCAGDCAHFFQIKDGELLRDNIERYTGDAIQFDKEPLSNEKYKLAESLVQQFPQYLRDRPNETIGCPDCADQGGYHLILNSKEESQYWHIDTSVDSPTSEIRAYIDQLKTTLEQLQN